MVGLGLVTVGYSASELIVTEVYAVAEREPILIMVCDLPNIFFSSLKPSF